MAGTKALWLEDWAKARGRSFLRFDYRGHGESSATFEEGCISDWVDDAREAIVRLTEGKQILVGSSMGGWVALRLAKLIPERIAGMIGIAAAPDFTQSMWEAMNEGTRAMLVREGMVSLPSEYSDEPYVITKRLIEDGRENFVLNQPLDLPFPVRLLQGTADTSVPSAVATRLLAHITCPDARLLLIKDADHRFSGPRELSILGKTLHGLTQAIRGLD